MHILKKPNNLNFDLVKEQTRIKKIAHITSIQLGK